eukprot:m51a1_g14543 hypothetical protein (334) ;mRNA; f:972231-975039
MERSAVQCAVFFANPADKRDIPLHDRDGAGKVLVPTVEKEFDARRVWLVIDPGKKMLLEADKDGYSFVAFRPNEEVQIVIDPVAPLCAVLEKAKGPWGSPLLQQFGNFVINSRVDSYASKYATFHLGSQNSIGPAQGPPVVVAKVARDFSHNSTIVHEHSVIRCICAASGGCAALPWVAPTTFLMDDRQFLIERKYATDLEREVRVHGPMPWPKTARCMTALLAAVEAADIAGFHHLDINPANIFLDDETDECVLADWGGARPDRFPGVPWTTRQYTLLDDTACSGLSVDLTAAATTLYHLVTGKVPQFHRVSELEVFVANGCSKADHKWVFR